MHGRQHLQDHERDAEEILQNQYDNDYTQTSDGAPLVSDHDAKESQTRPDVRRFYILLMFSLLAFTQSGVWNTWGSISASAEYAFGWEDSTIALLSNWGPISYIVSTLFFAWLSDVKGFRIAIVVTASLIAGGCGLRCITSTPPASTWLIHTGHFLNGLGGPILMGGPPLLSALWFPVHERTKATAFACVTAGLGNAVSYIIAPLLVPDVTHMHVHNSSNHSDGTNSTVVHHIRSKIMILMYIEFAWSFLLFVAVLVYYPNKPENAPSYSATVKRTEFGPAILKLVKNHRFWMLSIPYAVSCGVNNCWASILDVMLKPKGVTQETAGWVGFWSSIVATIMGMLVGIFADVFARRMKIMIVCLYFIATTAFLTFTLMYIGVFRFTEETLYLTNILGAAALGAAPPLLYELVCESTFPVAEGITNLFNTCLNNLGGLVFLLIPMFVSGTTWMNWFLVAAIASCIPVYIMFPEKYTRFDMDTQGGK